MTFELLSSEETHVVYSGNTKPFQAGFVLMKVKGHSMKASQDSMPSTTAFLRISIWKSTTMHMLAFNKFMLIV